MNIYLSAYNHFQACLISEVYEVVNKLYSGFIFVKHIVPDSLQNDKFGVFRKLFSAETFQEFFKMCGSTESDSTGVIKDILN